MDKLAEKAAHDHDIGDAQMSCYDWVNATAALVRRRIAAATVDAIDRRQTEDYESSTHNQPDGSDGHSAGMPSDDAQDETPAPPPAPATAEESDEKRRRRWAQRLLSAATSHQRIGEQQHDADQHHVQDPRHQHHRDQHADNSTTDQHDEQRRTAPTQQDDAVARRSADASWDEIPPRPRAARAGRPRGAAAAEKSAIAAAWVSVLLVPSDPLRIKQSPAPGGRAAGAARAPRARAAAGASRAPRGRLAGASRGLPRARPAAGPRAPRALAGSAEWRRVSVRRPRARGRGADLAPKLLQGEGPSGAERGRPAPSMAAPAALLARRLPAGAAAAAAAAAAAPPARGAELEEHTPALLQSTSPETWRPRLAAAQLLLQDLARVREAREHAGALAALLEHLWDEVRAAGLPAARAELLLHRLAEDYGHGTLRSEHVRRLRSLLGELGIGSVLDPLAHTGLHAARLAAAGLRVEAADASPAAACWWHVAERPGASTEWQRYGDGWALLLSWLPHWNALGEELLRGFRGRVLVVLGDEEWTGTDAFRDLLRRDWELAAMWHTDSPWPRVDERIRVYVRK
ncbi:unnamed protein product [Prorocentrum cordatum]|uniref:Uncharacterized protein n=1 Tax=Prorocentrum cordatum TaxID=2364126 RepID=A0ABN9PPG4_9DINO|nr:unnamed protein product [Polarella glacialis]